jgi:hypothetical protein
MGIWKQPNYQSSAIFINSYLPNVCGKRNFPRKHFPAYKENVETVELLIDNGTSVRDLRMTGL